MKRMVHYNSNGFVRCSTTIYESEEELPVSNKAAWIITILGLLAIFAIFKADLSWLGDACLRYFGL